jgi:hypothetical protein
MTVKTKNKVHGRNSDLPGKQEGRPIGVGLQPGLAREGVLPPRLDEIYPPLVDLNESEYTGDKQPEPEEKK